MGHRTAAEGYRVLILAPYGHDAASLADLLGREGYRTAILHDAAALGAMLDVDTGAVVMTEEAMRLDLMPLAQALERQPAWSDVPFVLLVTRRTGRADAPPPALPGAVGNIITLERPLGAVSLVSAVASAMRARQKQFEMRDRIAQLADSESRLRLATRAASIGTWDYDPQSGALNWDVRCKELFGLAPDAEITYEGSFVAGLHPDDRDAATAAVNRALEPEGDGRYHIEYRTIAPDGTVRWLAARGGSVFENGRAVRFIGTVIDISAPKEAAAALAVSEAALREESHALDTLNRVGQRLAAELDIDKLVQAVVDAGVELTGAQVGAFFYNSTDAAGELLLLYALSGAERALFEQFPAPRNTALFAPTFAGEGVVRCDDVRADSRYGLSDTHWGMPKDHLPVASYLAVPVASRSGEVIGALLFGHARAGVFGARAERLALGLAAQAAIAIDNARLLQSTQRLNQTLEEKVVERTAELEAEAENRARAEAALRQSQKMEAVGQLTGGIAHDFNNMLTGVIGAMDILRRRIAAGRLDDVDRFMDAASTSAQRAAALTARLLAFSRRQSLDSKPIDVNALVRDLRDLLARSVNENVRLRLSLADDLPAGIADAHQLESAILNLVINARDAMPSGGELTVETRLTEVDAAFAAARPEFTPGRYVVVAVSDTGVGIEEAMLDKVFEPFFTTKPIGQGTGLGLSMVYGFARQSGGHVRIHSQPGEGTSVMLYLPAAAAPALQADALVPAAVHGGDGETVLVVEDDASVRLLVRDVLQELGYVVLEAADPQAAIEILRRPDEIELMVSDVGLPGINGRQLADLARAGRPDLPILFVTGYAENAAIRSGFLGTNMAMITKPFALDTLAGKVREMLAPGAASD